LTAIEFHGRKETACPPACNQYSGNVLARLRPKSPCYEIGYGIATAGYGAMDGTSKKVNNQGPPCKKTRKEFSPTTSTSNITTRLQLTRPEIEVHQSRREGRNLFLEIPAIAAYSM